LLAVLASPSGGAKLAPLVIHGLAAMATLVLSWFEMRVETSFLSSKFLAGQLTGLDHSLEWSIRLGCPPIALS
jgi:hypothetical protein